MDELCRIHSSFDQFKNGQISDDDDDVLVGSGSGSDILKHQIANHPLYPNLVSAYIECRKIGAPSEMASLLEEISKEGHHVSNCPYEEVGVDPELDQFMETYCEALVRYKEMILKPLDESTSFFSNIVSQLNDLCIHQTSSTTTTTTSFNSINYHSDDAGPSSDEEIMYDNVEANYKEDINNQESSWGGGGGGDENEVKEMLMRKYSGYLSTLRKEFLKKRKKGKLPKNARSTLLDWWNTHYRWPYPTEEEKNKLSEMSGLDQKQINNWFINQRKRHWKPSEDMRFALMQGGSFATSS